MKERNAISVKMCYIFENENFKSNTYFTIFDGRGQHDVPFPLLRSLSYFCWCYPYYSNYPLGLKMSTRPPTRGAGCHCQPFPAPVLGYHMNQSRLLAWPSLDQVPTLVLAISRLGSFNTWTKKWMGPTTSAILIDTHALVIDMANRIMAGRFVGGNIFTRSVTLIEKMPMARARGDKILVTCQSLSFLSELPPWQLFAIPCGAINR